MRRFAILALTTLLLVSLAGWSCAQETDFDDLRRHDRNLPGWKLGRGLTNLVSGPHELLTNMINGAIKGAYWGSYSEGVHGYLAGSANGIVGGFFPGVKKAMRRTTLGALEILTFWKPEYGPTMDPEYGTRGKQWGMQDYFDPDPWWYNGPARR